MHIVHKVSGPVLWSNIHLLFWLSLVPFATAWMGENHFSKWPVILYGVILMMAGVAYYILVQCLSNFHGKDSALALAIGKDKKGIISVILYITGIACSFINPWIGFSIYVIVAAIWFIPDNRIEKKLNG